MSPKINPITGYVVTKEEMDVGEHLPPKEYADNWRKQLTYLRSQADEFCDPSSSLSRGASSWDAHRAAQVGLQLSDDELAALNKTLDKMETSPTARGDFETQLVSFVHNDAGAPGLGGQPANLVRKDWATRDVISALRTQSVEEELSLANELRGIKGKELIELGMKVLDAVPPGDSGAPNVDAFNQALLALDKKLETLEAGRDPNPGPSR